MAGLSALEFRGQPGLALGGPDLEAAAQALSAALHPASALNAEPHGALPFSSVRGTFNAQEGQRAVWIVDVSTRDLPPATRPQSLDIALTTPPEAGALASVFLNDVLLGSAAPPPDGRLRANFAIPERLIALDNRIAVTLQRPAPVGPAQLLPTSVLRLAPAGAPSEFLALPPFFLDGLEVLVEAPGGVTAESLNLPFWVLRPLLPLRSPLTVSAVDPGTIPRPRGPFISVTGEPPAGSAPRLHAVNGRIELTDRTARLPAPPPITGPALIAQLLESDGRPGIWLRPITDHSPRFAPSGSAPRLDRGDAALLDERGAVLAWTTSPAVPPSPDPPPPTAAADAPSLVQSWRPPIAWGLWLAGLVLVAYAFVRPRHNRQPA